MANDPSPLKSLLPAVLAKLAKESGTGNRLAPVWDQIVGPTIALNARPHALVDGVLTVRVTTARWSSELSAQAPQLLEKLRDSLGPDYVRVLQFELAPPR